MCGIAGIFKTSGAVSPFEIERMTNAIAHRGPDAAGFYLDGGVALGHRRLSILDLSDAANQPMSDRTGRYHIIYNGEIYNYKEIAADLDFPMKTTSDTEVIVEAFAKWGKDCVHRFNGMFAIAIWDKIESMLYFFLDRMGIKPLCYSLCSEGLFFASEIKGLRAHQSIEKSLSLSATAIHHFLYLGYIPGPDTIFNEIKRFPAGSWGTFDGTKLHIEPYWRLEDKVTAHVISDEEEAIKKYKELLESSVRYRMISDVPYGTFLSGGIDSSLVTSIAQSISQLPVKTFSIGFKESSFDESKYAEAVAKHLKTEHYSFSVSYLDALSLYDDILKTYDEPFGDSSSIPTMMVSRLSREYVTMVLSGDGGDETFLGYGFYNWAERLNHPLLQVFRKPLSVALSIAGNRYKRAAKVFQYQDENRIKSHIFSQEQYAFSDTEIDQLMLPQWKSKLTFDENFQGLARKLSPQEEQSLFDIKFYLKDDLLVKVDRATMKYALEARVPLIDYRLVEFSLSLSDSLKRRGKTTKYLMKQLLYQYVPKEIFDRPKWGFGMPIGKWLKSEWRDLVNTYLNEKTVKEAGLVKVEMVNELLKDYFGGKDYLYQRVWLLLLLHHWHSNHYRR